MLALLSVHNLFIIFIQLITASNYVWFFVLHLVSFLWVSFACLIKTNSLVIFCSLNQFAPIDTPVAVDAFFHYWKPNAILLMESELWPNLIMSAGRHGVSDLSCWYHLTRVYLYNCVVLAVCLSWCWVRYLLKYK